MSRKSVIQLVPSPTGCGDASDLRYRLLMAALGSSDEVNPLLAGPDSPRLVADEVAAADTVAESPVADANQNIPAAHSRAAERSVAAAPEGQPPSLSLVHPQTPPRIPVANAAGASGVPPGAATPPRPSKRR